LTLPPLARIGGGCARGLDAADKTAAEAADEDAEDADEEDGAGEEAAEDVAMS
jgi:hypothetical protein